MRARFESEAALAQVIATYLETRGYEVWAEVERIDIVAKAPEGPIGIEVKQHFTPKLVMQALRAKSWCGAAYLATPHNGDDATKWVAEAACARGGLGWLDVIDRGFTHPSRFEVVERVAPVRTHQGLHNIAKLLVPETRAWTQPGLPACRPVTTFRLSAIKIRDYVRLHPGCTVADVLGAVETHWAKRSAPYRLLEMVDKHAIDGVVASTGTGKARRLIPSG